MPLKPTDKTYSFRCSLQRQTEKAILVILADKKAHWIPLSQLVSLEEEAYSLHPRYPDKIVISEWIAKEKKILDSAIETIGQEDEDY